MLTVQWSKAPIGCDLAWTLVFVGLVFLLWIMVGAMKHAGCLNSGIARKLNHAGVLVGGAAWFSALPPSLARGSLLLAAVLLFGLLVVTCLFRSRIGLATAYYGYVRQAEAPHAGFEWGVSWLLAIYGVSLVDILFADWNLTLSAMLVLGLADAAGEVVGARWGRRRFAAPDLLFGGTHHRSWEGSTAVLLTTAIVLTARGIDPLRALPCALAVTLTEACSPRGCDNFTVPVACGCCLRLLTLISQ